MSRSEPIPDDRTPEVTVLVTTIGRLDFLVRAVDSALRQKDVELEVVLIDDCSQTDVEGTLARFDDPRLRVLRNPSRRGVARSRNRGLEEAAAPWIAFLDDDDVWAPDKLAAQLQATADGQAHLSYTSLVLLDEISGAVELHRAPDPGGLEVALRRDNVIGSPSSVLARVDVLEEVGGFDERLSVLADWDLWLRLAGEHPAVACAETLVAYTNHAANMHHRRSPRSLVGEFDYLVGKHLDRRPDLPPFERPRFLRWIGDGYRRGNRPLAAAAAYSWLAVGHRQPRALLTAVRSLAGRRTDRMLVMLGLTRPRPQVTAPGWLRRYMSDRLPVAEGKRPVQQ